MHFAEYLKRAFLNHWNLLAFGGSSAFALLGGPLGLGVALPLIAAAELTYVGLLSSHPKFQAYVDSEAAKAARSQGAQNSWQALARITQSLPRELLDRFESLRKQCLELRQIALELKHPGTDRSDLPLDEFQVAGLDKLLWIHLRLLYTQFALARFLKTTNEEQIRRDIAQLDERLSKLPPAAAGQDARVRKTLEDNLATSRARLENLQKARDNFELVKLEIDRLENKIRGLSELAVNRQEPEFISGQVDQVASSMLETERTMNELQFATGLNALDEQPPEFLRGKQLSTQT